MDQGIAEQNQALQALGQKLDVLAGQVAYLTEQAQAAERSRREQAELVETMMPIAKDGLRLASDQLDEIQEYVRAEDLLRLLKKLARHLPQLEQLLDQLDAVTDLFPILDPISKEAMGKAVSMLAGLEEKGYFRFANSGARIVDNIVTSFTEEDVNRLGDNIVLILNTVKDMTQPEIMTFIRNTLHTSEAEVAKPVNTSMWAILGQLRDPAVRRGLALTLRVLRVMGSQGAQN